jgi:hypothetical protein
MTLGFVALGYYVVTTHDAQRLKALVWCARTEVLNGTLLVWEVEVERKAGLDGVKEGLDFRRWGRG